MKLTQAITNPVIGSLGSANPDEGGFGSIIARIIILVWQGILTIGGLAVIIYLIWGGISWLTSGGDKQKVEDARSRITSAIIGMTLLFAAIAIVNFIGPALDFDILKIDVPTPESFR